MGSDHPAMHRKQTQGHTLLWQDPEVDLYRVLVIRRLCPLYFARAWRIVYYMHQGPPTPRAWYTQRLPRG